MNDRPPSHRPTRPWEQPLPVADLPAGRAHAFDLAPDAATRQGIADELGLLGLKKLRFNGTIAPRGKRGWQLTASLGASLTQACVLTLAPVPLRIDEPVSRSFQPDIRDPEPGSEYEIPPGDTPEPLTSHIDPGAIMFEALALALPAFPRAPGASLETIAVTEPGKTPMSDADTRPFAALKALKKPPGNDPG